MIILDTNVLSALMRQMPEAAVVEWLDRQPRSSVWTTAVTVMEIKFGLEILGEGKRKRLLMEALARMLDIMGDRVAAFDGEAAAQAAALMAARQRRGRPGDLRDTMIAGIVLARHATLATRNIAHFEELGGAVVNPWGNESV